ncbi:hypothetical protein Tco_1275664 [Tanacetum coccineum]
MAELVRLQIYVGLDDTWAWVAPRPERQQVAAAGALEAIEDALVVDEGALAVSAPVQAPQPPPHSARPALTMAQRDLSRFTVWAAEGISHLLDSTGATYVRYSETHAPYQRRRVRQRTDGASTSTAQQDEQQPDP